MRCYLSSFPVFTQTAFFGERHKREVSSESDVSINESSESDVSSDESSEMSDVSSDECSEMSDVSSDESSESDVSSDESSEMSDVSSDESSEMSDVNSDDSSEMSDVSSDERSDAISDECELLASYVDFDLSALPDLPETFLELQAARVFDLSVIREIAPAFFDLLDDTSALVWSFYRH